MDKRIAICVIAALLVLVVTAAYAPNTGSETKETEKGEGKEKAAAKTLDEVIENQEAILAELKVLKENQALMSKDLKYIRSKTH